MNTNENLELFAASAFGLIGLVEWWVASLVMFTPPTIATGVRARSIRS